MNTHTAIAPASPAITPRSPGNFDAQLGARLRLLRIAAGVSQTGLGETLNVSFQQIQKYEQGTNRIAASRLRPIANALGCAVTALHPDFTESHDESASPRRVEPLTQDALDFIVSPDGPAFAMALARLPATIRKQLLATARVAGDAINGEDI